jgi:hypothetical protein
MATHLMLRLHTFQGVSCNVHITRHPRYDLPSYLFKELQNIIIQLYTLNPSQSHTVDKSWGKWLIQGEESSLHPYTKTLPKLPDPTILASMSDLGYNPCEISDSLLGSGWGNGHILYAETAHMAGSLMHHVYYVPAGPATKVWPTILPL